MTRAEIAASLTKVRDALHAQFEGAPGSALRATHAGRLEQADAALATAAMAAEHLFDEDARERELADRIVNAESDDVRSPNNRSRKHYAELLGAKAGK